jgi:hypothetical protein
LVHGLAAAAGGSVQVQSELGKGTAISLLIPVANGARALEGGQAWVTVSDARLGALVRGVLEAMSFRLAVQRPADLSIWVTDATPDALTEINKCRATLNGCKFVALGHAEGDWSGLGAIVIEKPTPGSIRAAIERLMTSV